jgi:hypothetical protein
MSVSTIKFSQFSAGNFSTSSSFVGLSGTPGGNAIFAWPYTWTTATRPTPSNGLLGYNTNLGQYEYYDQGTVSWVALAVGTFPSFPLTLADGGTGSILSPNAGGILYSNSSQLELLGGTPIAGRMLQSGANAPPIWSESSFPSLSGAAGQIIISDGTNNIYSASTFASSYAANTILYANSSDHISGLAAANNSILVTDNTGVPSLAQVLPAAVQLQIGNFDNGMGASATTYFRGDGTWGTPSGSGGVSAGTINDLAFYAASGDVVSPVSTTNNGILVTNGAGVPSISTTTPTALSIPQPNIIGVTNASNATAGSVGEIIQRNILNASRATLTVSGTPYDITLLSLPLTAGDWDIYANLIYSITGSCSAVAMWTSLVSATEPDASLVSQLSFSAIINGSSLNAPFLRVSINSPATLYVSAISTFYTGTVAVSGSSFARRVR